jgi:hypothetical protein
MVRRISIITLVLGALLALSGCGDAGATIDLENAVVDTVVDINFLNAGATFNVSCLVADLDGREIKADTAFTVVPGKGVVVDHAKVTPKNAGAYVVTCMLPDGSLPDETPETVIVTKKNIARVETTLDANEVIGGKEVGATCTVLTDKDVEVDWDTELIVVPEGGITVTGHTLQADMVGDYEVACQAVDLPIIDTTPEPLKVIAGDPALVRATIKEEEVEAGTEVTVFCTVEDEYGNVLDLATVADAQDGIDAEGTTIIPRKAGEYDVTCSAVDDLGELEQVPDHLIVIAGPIASLVLTPKPKKNAYSVGDQVTILAQAGDAEGNPIEGEVDVEITAPEGIKIAGEKYEFIEEGIFTFKGFLVGFPAITGQLTLVCDENGPEIVLFKPERAATLTDDVMVDVEGHVADLFSDEIDLEINGTSVPVDGDGNFFHVVEAAHGMNILTVTAVDGFANDEKIVQSFYYSTEYVDYSTENLDDVLLEQSLILFLGQNFLDDGDHDKTKIDDVATLVEILLDSLDLAAIVPPDVPVLDQEFPDLINVPLLNQLGFELSLNGGVDLALYIEDVSFAEPFVAINTRDGGIDLLISFSGPAEDPGIYFQLFIELAFNLTVNSSFGGNELVSVGIAPGVALQSSFGLETLLVETSLDIHKNVGEELTIKVADFNIVPAGFHIELIKGDTALILGPININGQGVIDLGTINLGQLGFMQTINDFLSNNLIDPILDFIIPAVLDLVEPLVEDQVTKMLGDLLNQFEITLPIPLPQLPGADKAVEISFKTKFSSALFTEDGGELGLGAGFWAAKGVERDVLGSLLRAGCGGDANGWPTFDSAEKFMFAAALDMVNELLYAMWWGGGLNLSLDESVLGGISIDQFGITDLSVATDFFLPPILDDCTAKGMVELQLGDLLLIPSFKVMGAPVTISLYVSAALDAVIFGDGNEIGLQINGVTDIGTQIVSIDGNLGPLAGMFDIEQLVEGVLVPMIVEQVSNLSLGSFPIPEIDLSGIVPGIPPGTSLSLGNLVIEMSKGYLVFGGELL